MSSDDAKSLYDRGNSQKREGDLDGAIESYEQAINIQPDYAEAYSNLGNVQKQKGEIDTATKRTILLKPHIPPCFDGARKKNFVRTKGRRRNDREDMFVLRNRRNPWR